MDWTTFWTGLFVVGTVGYGLLAILVAIRGGVEVGQMLRDLAADDLPAGPETPE